jgi:hypothetical protein
MQLERFYRLKTNLASPPSKNGGGLRILQCDWLVGEGTLIVIDLDHHKLHFNFNINLHAAPFRLPVFYHHPLLALNPGYLNYQAPIILKSDCDIKRQYHQAF